MVFYLQIQITFSILPFHPSLLICQKRSLKFLIRKEKEFIRQILWQWRLQKLTLILKASEIVFAGFGTVDEKTGQNDYVGLDIKGKIVMISTGSSEMLTNEIPFSWNGVAETKKVEDAFNLEAAGVLLVNLPFDGEHRFFKNIIRENRFQSWFSC